LSLRCLKDSPPVWLSFHGEAAGTRGAIESCDLQANWQQSKMENEARESIRFAGFLLRTPSVVKSENYRGITIHDAD